MVSIETIINKQTYQNIHFPGKVATCKAQQIDFFLLINWFRKKMSIAFLNNNNLFLNINSLLGLSQSLVTNITIVPASVAYE